MVTVRPKPPADYHYLRDDPAKSTSDDPEEDATFLEDSLDLEVLGDDDNDTDDFSLADIVSETVHVKVLQPVGAAKIEGVAKVWGPRSRFSFILGLGIMVTVFSFDNTTIDSYTTYALSGLQSLSKKGTLDVITAVVTAITKLPIAKVSDVVGRAETYSALVGMYVLSHLIRATAPSFALYVAGSLFYIVGQAGVSILNMILISDLTSMRQRALVGPWLYVPFLSTPWISGLIVDKVIANFGWRWGYGMFTPIMPAGSLLLLATLFYLQRKAVKTGVVIARKTTLYDFCAQVDLGGLLLLCGGFALILLPMTLISQATGSWQVPLALVLITLGAVMLGWFAGHEGRVARYPAVPLRYFLDRSIICSLLLGCFDSISYQATHTYLFAWSVASHNFSPRNALYLSYTNGITMCLAGMTTGILMYRWRCYKRLCVLASFIRLLGYAVMVRLRTNDSANWELFTVQMVQGIGSGIIETTIFLCAQIVVSHAELAQVTALTSMGSHLGDGIGAAVAGGIYTSYLKHRLRVRMGDDVNEEQITRVYDSITGTLPEWGSAERDAVGAAFSDVMGYITMAALVASFPIILFAFVMPDNKLGDAKNLVEKESASDNVDDIPLRPAPIQG